MSRRSLLCMCRCSIIDETIVSVTLKVGWWVSDVWASSSIGDVRAGIFPKKELPPHCPALLLLRNRVRSK